MGKSKAFSSVEETSLTINFIFGIKPSFYIKTFNKMSETEAKTDAPTAEEIKGTKRAAVDEEDEEGLGEEEEGEGEEDLDDEAEGEEGEEEEDGEGEEEEEGDD